MTGLYRKQLRRRLLIALCAMAVFTMAILAIVLWALGPWPTAAKTLIVAEHINGTHLKVVCTQQFTGEPYEVSLWFKKPGETWQWLYVDHEDTYWWSGSIRVEPNGQRFDLYRGNKRVATADFLKNQYTLNGMSHGCVISDNPNEQANRRIPEVVQKLGL